jgi:long-chain acyl-CoA synthetase
MTGTAMAATLVLQHRFVPRRVLRAIETQRPTVFHAVPAMLCQLNKLMRTSKRDHTSINYCMSGGAPLPTSVAEEFARHTGAVVVEGYGLSEASPVTHAGPLDGTARTGTIGLPLPDTEVRLVDADTGYRPVGPGEVGEITVRAPQVMLGYWNDPEATSRAIRDGWLYTGDLAVCDDQGFFRIVDRKKDLIITSGFNVYPSDVERVIAQFPGIQDAAVVGVPDADRGEIVKVVLVLERGKQFDRKVFLQQCKMHLAKHKQPRLIEVAEGDLPRNFLGKVLRKDLRT